MGKIITRFDPNEALIYVQAVIRGPLGQRDEKLILDTGASESFLIPGVMDAIGYSARDAVERTSVTSIAGVEYGYRLCVEGFSALGFDLSNYSLNVHDLPDDCGFSGLLGLSFLRHLRLELWAKEGLLLAEQAL